MKCAEEVMALDAQFCQVYTPAVKEDMLFILQTLQVELLHFKSTLLVRKFAVLCS